MALALVPQARGRGEKTANFWQKSSTFDPISEGTRRKKTAAGTTGRWNLSLPQLLLVRDPRSNCRSTYPVNSPAVY